MEEYKNITISELKFKGNLCNELLKGYKKIDEFDENEFSHISFIPLAFRKKIHNIRKVTNQRIRCHLCYIKNKESKITSYRCDKCNIAIHMECIAEYHDNFNIINNFKFLKSNFFITLFKDNLL